VSVSQLTFLEQLEGAGVLSPSVDFGHAGNLFLVCLILPINFSCW